MNEELGTDIIDGKIIDWSKISEEDLQNLEKKIQKKEKEILDKINSNLEQD